MTDAQINAIQAFVLTSIKYEMGHYLEKSALLQDRTIAQAEMIKVLRESPSNGEKVSP